MPHRLQQKVASDMGKWWILGSSTFSNLNLNHSDFIQELGPVLSLCLADSENKGHSTVVQKSIFPSNRKDESESVGNSETVGAGL